MASSPLHSSLFAIIGIQCVLALEWLRAGIEKLSSGAFPTTFAKTIEKFQTNNPHPWYGESVLSLAKTYPLLFGHLVQWGELFVGLGLLGSALLLLSSQISLRSLALVILFAALSASIVMNLNFYFAAGWMSPSTSGLNALMIGIELILLAFWLFQAWQKRLV